MNYIQRLAKKLSEKEFSRLKAYIFQQQREKYKRFDLVAVRKFAFSVGRRPESRKMLYDYLISIWAQAQRRTKW